MADQAPVVVTLREALERAARALDEVARGERLQRRPIGAAWAEAEALMCRRALEVTR